MLAHERAHLRRGDLLVNALAVAWLSLSWFNPLAHWAFGRMRFDQDLACDATVLAGFDSARRRYARALLTAQLAGEHETQRAFVCHWTSTHPLRERVAALAQPLPSAMRHRAGATIACAAVIAGSTVFWQSAPHAQATRSDPSSVETQPAPAAPEQYLIQAGDLLLVVVANEESLSRTVRVRPDGEFSMALVADFPAAGKTAAQVGRELEQELSQFLRNPEVAVSVQERAGGPDTVPQSVQADPVRGASAARIASNRAG
jgi:hypothetical protein